MCSDLLCVTLRRVAVRRRRGGTVMHLAPDRRDGGRIRIYRCDTNALQPRVLPLLPSS